MAFDEYLGERIALVLKSKKVLFEEKRMFGGLAFMIDGKMSMGIVKNEMMARINPNIYEESLKKEGCNEMNFTGRPMKGMVFLEATAVDLQDDLEYWIDLCLAYNPLAKASKKKKN